MIPRTVSPALRGLQWVLAIVFLAVAYSLSWHVTQPDFLKLVSSAPKAKQIMTAFLTPDIVARQAQTLTATFPFPIPCGSAAPAAPSLAGLQVSVEPSCATALEKFTLRGSGFTRDTKVTARWLLPDGGTLPIDQYPVDAQGQLEVQIQARPIAATQNGVPAELMVEVDVPGGALRPTPALRDVVNAIMVTIFMALLATTFGTIIAAPLSFLAAHNITRRGWLGTTVYYLVRSILNLTRSYEPLVLATVFALIVGFGSPFAGVVALVVTTSASLGKMFSEAVENIDPGPIEAITATGANRAQVVLYGVVPQIIPDFLSYTIYHWDINVRISTVIGFVGGGGIGYYISQHINSFEYHKVGTAIIAIVIVVWVLDFLSSQVRKQLA